MTTNAQLQAEIQQLAQATRDTKRIPNNLSRFSGKRGEDVREWLFQIKNTCRIYGFKIEDDNTTLPAIAGSAMDKPAAGCFLRWPSTTDEAEHKWGIFRERVLQQFEASNYQSFLRDKLQRLKQTGGIESYNGEYSSLIFRVEAMSLIDQVMHYANGLKPKTRSYVKLEDPKTLSEAMDLAVKYEVTHFVDELRDRHVREIKHKVKGKRSREDKSRWKQPFKKFNRYKPSSSYSSGGSKEDRVCHHCGKLVHIKANCFAWKKQQGKPENERPRQ